MIINQTNWKEYVQKLSSISKRAGDLLQDWIDKNGIDDMAALINYAIALSDKYGEAGASLAAEMYDEIAQLSGVSVSLAEVANTATYKEVAQAMYGTVNDNQKPSATMERLVKQASADTMRKNAIRDGAQWAWIPSGDTCAFCITLASKGWQKASKKTLKGEHCNHIHAHCDCQFMIRFNNNTNVEGYNPQEYRRIYDNAEGTKPQDKINAIRRMQYQENKVDKMGLKIKTSFNSNKGGKTISFSVHKAEGTNIIYQQTNSSNSQNTVELLKNSEVEKRYGEINQINLCKTTTLNGIGAYDQERNILFLSEDISDNEMLNKMLGDNYFSAKNAEEVIEHELGGHKRHWDNVKRYYEDNKESYSTLDDAKKGMESKLQKYVSNQLSNDVNYISNIVSENANESFFNSKKLNELIADATIKIQNGSLKDEHLGELVEEILNYDANKN